MGSSADTAGGKVASLGTKAQTAGGEISTAGNDAEVAGDKIATAGSESEIAGDKMATAGGEAGAEGMAGDMGAAEGAAGGLAGSLTGVLGPALIGATILVAGFAYANRHTGATSMKEMSDQAETMSSKTLPELNNKLGALTPQHRPRRGPRCIRGAW